MVADVMIQLNDKNHAAFDHFICGLQWNDNNHHANDNNDDDDDNDEDEDDEDDDEDENSISSNNSSSSSSSSNVSIINSNSIIIITFVTQLPSALHNFHHRPRSHRHRHHRRCRYKIVVGRRFHRSESVLLTVSLP